jgi:hypothetical protein
MPERQEQNERANQVFTWDRFDGMTNFDFAKLNLTSDDLNQQVLYRIIERGGSRSGGRRGFRFAKEMKLDTILPISYAITDNSDPHISDFLKQASNDFSVYDAEKIIIPTGYFAAKGDPKNWTLIEKTLKEVLSRDNRFLQQALQVQ